jgi:hypothetical protein
VEISRAVSKALSSDRLGSTRSLAYQVIDNGSLAVGEGTIVLEYTMEGGVVKRDGRRNESNDRESAAVEVKKQESSVWSREHVPQKRVFTSSWAATLQAPDILSSSLKTLA